MDVVIGSEVGWVGEAVSQAGDSSIVFSKDLGQVFLVSSGLVKKAKFDLAVKNGDCFDAEPDWLVSTRCSGRHKGGMDVGQRGRYGWWWVSNVEKLEQ